MSLIRRPRRIGLFVFILLAVLVLDGTGAFLYSNTSQKTSDEQASKEATIEETTARAPTGSTQLKSTAETTAGTIAVPEKTAPATVAPASRVSAIGDSVMLGALDMLQRKIPNLATIDAQGCLQAPAAIDILRRRRAAGQLGDVVIVRIGNTDP